MKLRAHPDKSGAPPMGFGIPPVGWGQGAPNLHDCGCAPAWRWCYSLKKYYYY